MVIHRIDAVVSTVMSGPLFARFPIIFFNYAPMDFNLSRSINHQLLIKAIEINQTNHPKSSWGQKGAKMDTSEPISSRHQSMDQGRSTLILVF